MQYLHIINLQSEGWDKMNKLMGFFELRDSSLPVVPWKEYNKQVVLDADLLWTIRTAVFSGNDLNLPRLIGARSEQARIFADKTLDSLKDKGIVIYYPFFLAEKSGTMNIYKDHLVVEAVSDDLWNLVTYSNRDVTIFIKNDVTKYHGNEEFLSSEELTELNSYVPILKRKFRDYLLEDKSILVEWSFAYNSSINKNRMGDKYLVFYEARVI